ncbi:amino acid adenylation domain-containing protein [Streptomyces sp. JB150]|uniref:non-ribosomal peptide synthetase n=1 Tax=Streptomyces sp. JB150 TaxID=2714844 RepID=UPI001408C0CD|nr:amino acid adenylation domain-containing protein [Streptomyces sp. JB150]QIJ60787.1 amino acid adenylation domain-containing protein [Streptomyces sp. JB150]
METRVEADRDYWSRVLTAGGVTPVPRWVRRPVPGTAEREVEVPPDVTRSVRDLVARSGVPVSALLLAAHAKVLAALSGEQEVVTGYTAGVRGEPLPCRVSVAPRPWRALLSAAERAEAAVLAHREFPVTRLRHELGLTEPPYDVVFGPSAAEQDRDDDAVVRVCWSDRGGRLVLRLRYRTDALDAGSAARIGGYHLAALKLMTADPDADHTRQSLLSADEVREQLDGLAGPRRPLPDVRPHQLFEQRARTHPEAVAAVHGEHAWTYGELNARANRLAWALLRRGLGREDVVAVVTERTLDWLAATLAVFKAGGVYLPVEPHFPADRIAATLERAGCRLVLAASGSTGHLDAALTTVPAERLLMETAYAEGHADTDPGVRVDADQLAYIYFTSGSTGEPKGAMCEHAGMLNHLRAKIGALGIGEGSVVAQTAPQCFDISLWQLVAALLVGGRTVLVGQDAVVDVERFLDTLARDRVNVAQVVPSYLEVVVAHLEQRPRVLPHLRYVSVTGEALKRELVQRWFAVQPDVPLLNAYGLTETSDDTNHELLDGVPDRVLLGRPVDNVHVYLVDERLSLVPLGAPGLIAFSGVCVGRGYVNDPERTRAAYRADPYRPGERLYLGGDWGRWHPDGKLEFLGRRDNQVKIRGFRIEIGEIENALLRVDGVRDAAVVVVERAGESAQLVAFHTGTRRRPEALREELATVLPAYMIPSAFHWRESLPLTANGKTDRKALTEAAGRPAPPTAPDTAGAETLSPAERRLAAVWATLLDVPEHLIGPTSHFFESGGTSLSAVRLTLALDRAVSLKDITRHPVLADLAALLEGRERPRPRLLQPLCETAGPPECVLVCFPYAGGNAVNYQPMADALAGSGVAVLAVDPPGHDLGATPEPFASIARIAERVTEEITQEITQDNTDDIAEEITARGTPRIMLWGHSSGCAPALETARRLQERGVRVTRVFLGAQLLGSATDRSAAIDELTQRGDREIAARLAEDSGYPELAEVNARHAEHIGAAYRHDCVLAHRYLRAALQSPPPVRLSAPVTVVVAADDPHTRDYARRHLDWQLLAEHVDLCELPDGGHYFPRTRPAAAAQAVLTTAVPLASG